VGWVGVGGAGWAGPFSFSTLFYLHNHVIQLVTSLKMLWCCSIHLLDYFYSNICAHNLLICILSGSCSCSKVDNVAWHCCWTASYNSGSRSSSKADHVACKLDCAILIQFLVICDALQTRTRTRIGPGVGGGLGVVWWWVS